MGTFNNQFLYGLPQKSQSAPEKGGTPDVEEDGLSTEEIEAPLKVHISGTSFGVLGAGFNPTSRARSRGGALVLWPGAPAVNHQVDSGLGKADARVAKVCL